MAASARRYTVTSGLTSLAASTTKVACQIATGSTVTACIVGVSVWFDSTATGSGAIPVRVALVRATGASSGGATFTPAKWRSGQIAANTTARINDTSDGASPTILDEVLVSPTAGLPTFYALGREFDLDASDFFEVRLTSQAGMTTCNYIANLYFEE